MVKGRVAPPKCLFYVATRIEGPIYSNITVNTLGLVKKNR